MGSRGLILSSLGPTTSSGFTFARVVDTATSGRESTNTTVLLVGTIAAVIAALTGLWLVYALRRERAFAEFSPGFVMRRTDARVKVGINVHVVQGSSPWKVKQFTIKFWEDGRPVADVEAQCDFPRYGSNDWTRPLEYEIPDSGGIIEAQASVTFQGGGSYKLKRHTISGQ
jgi:hypothetical protein